MHICKFALQLFRQIAVGVTRAYLAAIAQAADDSFARQLGKLVADALLKFLGRKFAKNNPILKALNGDVKEMLPVFVAAVGVPQHYDAPSDAVDLMKQASSIVSTFSISVFVSEVHR